MYPLWCPSALAHAYLLQDVFQRLHPGIQLHRLQSLALMSTGDMGLALDCPVPCALLTWLPCAFHIGVCPDKHHRPKEALSVYRRLDHSPWRSALLPG